MTPLEVFVYCVAGAVGAAVGLVVFAGIIAAGFVVGSALIRKVIG
jgi:hypothetical protein